MHKREAGMASILTVIFFMLISSVIAVGFLRLAVQEGEQTLEDDLSKAAYAAAFSGVNDAKRALLLCKQSPGSPGCNGINNTSCPGFFGTYDASGNFTASPLAATLGISPDTTTGNVVVGDPTLSEQYTCVVITSNTPAVAGNTSTEGFVPLEGVATPAAVRISWHKLGVGVTTFSNATLAGKNRVSMSATGTGTKWTNTWPALLRSMLIQHPSAGVTIAADDVGASNVTENTFFLYPVSTAPASSANITATYQDIQCTSGGFSVDGSSYACQATLNYTATGNSSYLYLTSLYKDTDYAVQLLDGSGSVINFNGVSPMIDATARAQNVFRRVKARVMYEGAGVGGRRPILPNAIDSGSGLCKNFDVGGTAAPISEDCSAP